MTCTVEARARVERAARSLRDTAPTIAVEVLDPADSPHDRWTLDAAIRTAGVPPTVLRELALAGLTLLPTPAQGEFATVVATV
ncbi:hypothetical protein [Haloarcula marina]|uniref:hypothetical protein n=1 Tax=Haloarcula marina TaxID=2961574 RepID=UPI0020B66E15|nr:hypothetical protein [Halomicroarcula marina]